MPHKLLEIFPISLRRVLEHVPVEIAERMEEIRIRENRPLEIGYDGRYSFVKEDGTPTEDERNGYKPDREACRNFLELLTNHSLYAMEEELRRGFVTIAGGHRIGLAGRTLLEGGKVSHLRDIAGFNVRIARAKTGSGIDILPGLLDFGERTIRHTLIVSPPQQGKTTLIRDLARRISAGAWNHPAAGAWRGRKVGIVDERSEIAACERGVPTFDLGPRCDVLDGCPKAEGVMMLIRSMSPEVIVVDEIGRSEDAEALIEAMHAGVKVLATAHASSLQDVLARPALAKLAADGRIGTFVFLNRTGNKMTHRIVRTDGPPAMIPEAQGGRTLKSRELPVIRSPAGSGPGAAGDPSIPKRAAVRLTANLTAKRGGDGHA